MKQKHILPPDQTPINLVLVTLDTHLGGVLMRAEKSLRRHLPNLSLKTHAAANWNASPDSLEECKADIASGDIILVTMLFMEDHINAVLPALTARKDHCDAMVCCMSASEVMQLTRMGRFRMDAEQTGAMGLLKRLRGKSQNSNKGAGAQQLSVLKKLPSILRFIPGTAQDVRAYFLTLQYWLAGSEDNLKELFLFLVDRYAEDERSNLKGLFKAKPPVEYPEVGVYHPSIKSRVSDVLDDLPITKTKAGEKGIVGLLVMRSYVLAGNSAHYDAVIKGFEDRGISVITAFASGLDARPAVQKYFLRDGKSRVDAVLSLTGFSLVGGPAYNDSAAAEDLLAELDVPYVAAQALEFQSVDDWQASELGLLPIEATMMVAIPELDGATGPIVFGGRTGQSVEEKQDMKAHDERVRALVSRVEKLVSMRRRSRDQRKLAIVLFNFPPNAGNVGTAAHLAVFKSLYNTLVRLSEEGYSIDLPSSVDELQSAILEGNARKYGSDANVLDRISVDDYVREEVWLDAIEEQWGPAPGKQLTDGKSIWILGARFGNVVVTVQPPMGYEGDPMRLLFEGGHAPTHAFSAFYRYLKDSFMADAVLHFGTHGALEFMPGKQVGLSENCWPDRLIGALPNFYLYAANNPSEGLIAKRRSAATLVSYLTPPVIKADLNIGLQELKELIERWRCQPGSGKKADPDLAKLIETQADSLDLIDTPWAPGDAENHIIELSSSLTEIEQSLIPYGMHVVGEAIEEEHQIELLQALAKGSHGLDLDQEAAKALTSGLEMPKDLSVGSDENKVLSQAWTDLKATARLLREDHELPALVKALDGGFIRPVAGGDLLRNPEMLPTGRNIHGFDPYRLPSSYATKAGAKQADLLLATHEKQGNGLPESLALVLWGTDNLKSEGEPIAQALALIGAEPRFDTYGRLCGARLIPLDELGRPRVDVIVTMSGIFRDLLPLQTRMLAEAAFLAASAQEPEEQNFIRKHVLAYMKLHDCDLETASLRVFSNSEGAYGSNVNMLIDSGRWDDEDELAETYTKRKCYAYSRSGNAAPQADLLTDMLASVDFAYQNLDSVELGVTTVDHYFDTLGGISRSIKRASGKDVPIYISDQTTDNAKVRTLSEQVALETRTRVLNPKWYENMLEYGFEGVRSIETHVTNTVGWSATTGQVSPWVYKQLSETFILDEDMRKRLSELNPAAAVSLANRLLEAHDRDYWNPDDESLDALRKAGEDMEDWLEGVTGEIAA